MMRSPPRSTLFPYTTPSQARGHHQHRTHIPPANKRIGQPWQLIATAGTDRQLEQRCHGELLAHVETDRKSTRLNSSHANISYAVFCLKKKKHRACCPRGSAV